MHSLQKTWPLRQQRGSMKGLRQRQQASKGLIESLPKRSFCVPYPSFLFSSYVKNARSLLFFECLCGILASSYPSFLPRRSKQSIRLAPNCLNLDRNRGRGWGEREREMTTTTLVDRGGSNGGFDQD